MQSLNHHDFPHVCILKCAHYFQMWLKMTSPKDAVILYNTEEKNVVMCVPNLRTLW